MSDAVLSLIYYATVVGGASIDLTTLAVGIAGGAAAGVLIAYFVFFRRPTGAKVRVVQRDEDGQLRRKTVTLDELDCSKREMRTIMLERDLLSAALTKIYEAESDGRITREEREMIARRYSSQIREYEAKLRDKELIVEVGELEKLRDELVSLFREKIENIETRLDQAKERMPSLRSKEEAEAAAAEAEAAVAVAAVARPEGLRAGGRQVALEAVTPADDLERVVERKAPSKKDETEGERRVKALRDEVMDALARLEQMDVKKEDQGNEKA